MNIEDVQSTESEEGGGEMDEKEDKEMVRQEASQEVSVHPPTSARD